MMTSKDYLREIDYHKKDLLVDLLWTCIMRDTLPPHLNNCIKEIAAYCRQKHNAIKISDRIPFMKDYKVLGMELKPCELTISEKREIQSILEKNIKDDYPKLLEEIDTLTKGEIKDKLKYTKIDHTELTIEERKIIDLCMKCDEQLHEMYRINKEMCLVMKEWIDLRLSTSVVQMKRKAELCSYKSKINELQAKLISLQMKKMVYRGSTAVRNFMEYYLNMKTKLNDMKKEIKQYEKFLNQDEDDIDLLI